MEFRDNIGIMIEVFIGILLLVILIPFVSNTSEQYIGNASDNKMDSFLFINDLSSNAEVFEEPVGSLNNVSKFDATYLSFLSSGDRVTTTNEWAVDNRTNLTIWARVTWNVNASGTNESIISKSPKNGVSLFSLGIDNATLSIQVGNSSACRFGTLNLITALNASWFTVAVTRIDEYVGTDEAINYTIYVNGYPQETIDAYSCDNLTDGIFVLGSGQNIDDSWMTWNGSIDEIRIYNSTLSAADVLVSHDGLVNLTLINRWKFNEYIGTNAYDFQETADGTITGATFNKEATILTLAPSSINSTGWVTLPDENNFDYITVSYQYDSRSGTFSSTTKAIMILIGVLFGIAIIAFAYFWIRNNLEDFY